MFRALLVSLLLVACSSQSQPTAPVDPGKSPKYLGIILLYVNGQYVNNITSGRIYENIHECLDTANATISKAIANEAIPKNGNAIGACLPVPVLKTAPVEVIPKGPETTL